mmetsp:Transcript_184/g.694  ORF Transcript_184/g.694 Transcript_184/m.694 type:complete len:229 (+) Transcript_184:1299-1985(+)
MFFTASARATSTVRTRSIMLSASTKSTNAANDVSMVDTFARTCSVLACRMSTLCSWCATLASIASRRALQVSATNSSTESFIVAIDASKDSKRSTEVARDPREEGTSKTALMGLTLGLSRTRSAEDTRSSQADTTASTSSWSRCCSSTLASASATAPDNRTSSSLICLSHSKKPSCNSSLSANTLNASAKDVMDLRVPSSESESWELRSGDEDLFFKSLRPNVLESQS